MVGPLQQFLQQASCVEAASATLDVPVTLLPATPPRVTGALSHLQRLGTYATSCMTGGSLSPTTLLFRRTLEQWVRDATATEAGPRQEAARRISTAFRKHSAALDLATLGLTSLPPCLQALSSLQILNIRSNRLATLPELPPFVQRLMVQKNRLTVLPALPVTLRELHAGRNALTSLPMVPQWVTLLHVDYNRIERLAPFPSGLVSFSASHNRLDELPYLPPTLRNLIVGNNRLRELPALRPIQQPGESTWNYLIDVSDNALSGLPSSFESARPNGRFDNNPWSDTALARLAALQGATIIDDRPGNGTRLVINNRPQ